MTIPPSRPQVLWQVRIKDTTGTGELRDPGRGWSVQIFRGNFRFTEYRGVHRERALAWAQDMRTHFPAGVDHG